MRRVKTAPRDGSDHGTKRAGVAAPHAAGPAAAPAVSAAGGGDAHAAAGRPADATLIPRRTTQTTAPGARVIIAALFGSRAIPPCPTAAAGRRALALEGKPPGNN